MQNIPAIDTTFDQLSGRRTLVRQFDGPRSYSYDAAGRVTAADNPSPLADEAFAYDELGNRTGGGEVVDAANRLQSRAGFSYSWDREGRQRSHTNTQTGEVTRFGWSDDGRLRSVTLPSGGVVRYAYDPMGRRITTTSTNGVRRVQTYGLDPNAVAEHTGGDPRTRYTFGLGYDTPLAMSTASSTAFFEQDALSSVTSLTNTAGAITGRASYDTYGQITSQTGQASPYTYTGREHEPETGLYHYRARWYDPATGTFTSEDPVPAANLYAYAEGRPQAANDPTGRLTFSDLAANNAFVSGLVSANVNYWGSAIRCGVPDNSIDAVGQVGLGFFSGAIFGGGASWVGKKLLGAIGASAAQSASAVALALLTYSWFTSPARHVVGNGSATVDEDDALAWLVDTVVGTGTATAGAFANGPVAQTVLSLVDLIAGTGTQSGTANCV